MTTHRRSPAAPVTALTVFALCALVFAAASPAIAQPSRVGDTQVLFGWPGGNEEVHPDIALDPVNDIYLVVHAYGPIRGTFVNSSGTAIGSTFTISDGTQASSFDSYASVRYSPDVSNGAGGHGGFLVAWHHFPGYVYSAVVAYEAPNKVVSGPTALSELEQSGMNASNIGPAIAYSQTSRRFLVAWSTNQFGVLARLVDVQGAPIGNVFALENAGGARDPAVTWNSATNEFGLFYSGFGGSGAFVAFRRVAMDGTPSGRTTFGFSAGTMATGIETTSDHRYVAAWAVGPGVRTAVFDQSGTMLTGPDGTFVTGRFGYNWSMGWSYNPTNGTFLAASTDSASWDIGAAETDGSGAPLGTPIVATSGGAASNGGSYYPEIGSRNSVKEWTIAFMVGGSIRTQIMAPSGSVVTPPPSGTCTVSATASGPTQGNAAAAQSFTATPTASSGCGGVVSYAWSFGDGGTSTLQNPSYTYASAGTYNWSVTITAGSGTDTATTTQNGTIQVLAAGACTPSTATVLAQPGGSGLDALWQSAGVTVTAGQLLSISVSGGQTWTYQGSGYTADGNASAILTGANVPMSGGPRMALVGRIGTTGVPFLIGSAAQFTPTASGTLYLAPNHEWYMVSGNSGSLSVSICRGGTSCSVDATATVPSTAGVSSSVSFAVTATPSGCSSATPTYSWSFGDGGTSTSQNPTHTYASAGTFSWSVTVQVAAATVTKSGSITVLAANVCVPSTVTVQAAGAVGSPTITTMWKDTGIAVTSGQLVTLSLAGSQTWSSDGTAFYSAAGNSGNVYSSGNANVPLPGGASMALVGRIGASGTPFLVGVWSQATAGASGNLYLAPNEEWYNLNNNTGSLSVSVCVGGAACALTATATVPTSAVTGSAVSFAATCSTNNCGIDPATTYAWNFGDGSTSASQNPTHTYALDGTYTWTLTITNQSSGVTNGTTTKTGTISVATPSCTATAATIVARGSGTNLPDSMWQSTGATVTAGQTLSITASGTWANAGASYTAGGNASDLTFPGNSALGGAPRMALVGRIGATGTPFLVGASYAQAAAQSGTLYLAPNDDWYALHDNTGSLSAAICVGAAGCSVTATATVPSTATPGTAVSFASTATATSCAGSPTYAWSFGDGATSTSQNPAHTYAAQGTYNWTLTVTAGSATTTKTGSIVVSSSTCTATVVSVAAGGLGTNQPGSMFVDSGLVVTTGQAVTITASGSWMSGGTTYSAVGNGSDLTYPGNSALGGAPRMALIGRGAASGPPFLVGSSVSFIAGSGGQLFLAANDDWYYLHDNSGSLSVTVCK